MRTQQGRQTLLVERRALPPRSQPTLTLSELPVPPIMGGAFSEEGFQSRKARYRAWRSAASWQARLQQPRRVRGPVAISITVEETARADLETLATAPIDLLCDLNLIEGDQRNVIREVRLQWGNTQGMRIEVRPV